MIVGKLNVDVSGTGISNTGSSGWVRTDRPSAAALILRNETSGKDYEIRAAFPDGFFALANAQPGHYRLLELWAQVKTDDSYVTITSRFYKDIAFDLGPGRVANLGVNDWNFSYDLSHSASANDFVLNSDFPAVEQALHRFDAHSQWTGYRSDQVAFSGEASAKPQAEALPPRDSNNQNVRPMITL